MRFSGSFKILKNQGDEGTGGVPASIGSTSSGTGTPTLGTPYPSSRLLLFLCTLNYSEHHFLVFYF